MKRAKVLILLALVLVFAMVLFSGCAADEENGDVEEKYVIGFSNCSMGHSWRAAMYESMMYELEKHDNIELIVTDAADNASKQISDIEDMLARGIDLLIVSPAVMDALAPIVDECFDRGIPVVVVDRSVATEKYNTFVATNQKELGLKVAGYIVEEYDGVANYINLEGSPGAGPNEERNDGLYEIFKDYPGMVELAKQPAHWNEATALEVMENLLQAHQNIDIVITSNGDIALGAYRAIQAAGRENEIDIVSIDASRNDCLEALRDGIFKPYTAINPVYCGGWSLRVAIDILQGKTVAKNMEVPAPVITLDNVNDFIVPGAPPGDYSYWGTMYDIELDKHYLSKMQ